MNRRASRRERVWGTTMYEEAVLQILFDKCLVRKDDDDAVPI